MTAFRSGCRRWRSSSEHVREGAEVTDGRNSRSSRTPARGAEKFHLEIHLQRGPQGNRDPVFLPGPLLSVCGLAAFDSDPPAPGLAAAQNPLARQALARGRAGRDYHPGVLPGAADPARHDHGFLRADDRTPGRLWQLHPADSDRRRRHGLSAPQHALVLDDVCRPGGHHGDVFCGGRPAHFRLDGLSAAQCRGWGCRPGAGGGPNPVDHFHRHFLRGLDAGRAQFHCDDA